MVDSPIFIVGCPRSGTGLLRDLLRSHPNITFPNESHFIPKLFKAYGDPRNEREARKIASIILKLNWVRVWDLSLAPSLFAGCRSYREIICRLYEEWMRKEGKIRWGDKTPQYVTQIPTLLEIFPSSKIIHIYRDGRDVALSWLKHPFGPESVFMAAHRWKDFVSTGRGVGTGLPAETYLEISYERLLFHPEATMRSVCEFLGEPFCRDVLRPNRTEVRAIKAQGYKRISDSEIVTSNSSKWKKSMSSADRVLFESIAGDLLRDLGYQTEGKTRPISHFERLKWKTHHNIWCFRQIPKMRYPVSWIADSWLLHCANLRSRVRSV